MAKINIQYIKQDIRRAAPQFKNLARGAALSRFNRLKQAMISEFFNHAITKEIEGGPDARNSSGVVSRGNLFSFIGFTEGSDPITPIVNVLAEGVLLGEVSEITTKKDMLVFGFDVLVPTKKEISEASPLPWLTGRSWVYGVEDGGISGIGNYLFHRFFPREQSRSTVGIQSKRGGMGATFTPRSYLGDILKRFKEKV